MIEDSAALLPIWMVLSAAFGFFAGEACGDHFRHRKCLEKANAELREQLNKSRLDREPLQLALKQQRSVVNDIHSRLVAVSKALEKRSS